MKRIKNLLLACSAFVLVMSATSVSASTDLDTFELKIKKPKDEIIMKSGGDDPHPTG
ncbi:hypothetical protein [Cytobacillus sp. IB215665]|uniref:hypothetical protein n=1 Tax=Cytobacillus sp. IB215665 TaxID=3097357 RepID=UPI002A1119ED|nr:hypothetical protein [Cytobacillus sp. IB215665]MDX8367168.1 hypothetical protein [Cytobacillus sp. IB215665]